nr:hypothetical protein [Mesorhizobium camelthorni]
MSAIERTLQRASQLRRNAFEFFHARIRERGESQRFLFDIPSRSYVGLFDHWHDMSVSVWHVATCKEKSDALNAIEPFLSPRDLLPQFNDLAREIRGKVVEVNKMFAWHDLNMASANRRNVEKGQQAIVLENDIGPNLAPSHLAEEARD